MENRAHAIVAVSFLIIVSVGALAAYYWLTSQQSEPRIYRIVTSQSVGSLQKLSPVTFKGLLVGHVQRVGFSEQHPAKVEIVFSVQRNAMVTESTYAVLARQDILGGTALELKLGEGSRTRLETRRQAPAQIPLRKGLFARLKSKGMESLNRINHVLARLESLLDADNRQHVDAILAQVDKATHKLVTIERRLAPVMKALPELDEKIRKTLEQSRTLLVRASQLAQTAEQPLEQIGGTATTAQAVMHEFRQQLLPKFSRLSDSLTRTSRALRKLSQQLQAHPRSLIFGSPEQKPGPGEPGFGARNTR